MSLKDFSKEDVLNAMGLASRKHAGDYVLPALGIFGAGMLVGAGLGLLFAPKPGREIRHDIGEKVNGLGKRVEATAGDLGRKVENVASDLGLRSTEGNSKSKASTSVNAY